MLMLEMKMIIHKNWCISSLIGQTMVLSNREAIHFTTGEIVTTHMVTESRKSMIKMRICLAISDSHMLTIVK